MLQALRQARAQRSTRWVCMGTVVLVALVVAGGLWPVAARAQSVPEPPPACDGLILSLDQTLTGVCRAINGGFACYGLDSIAATFRAGATVSFAAAGNLAPLESLASMTTNPGGAGLLVSGAHSGRVKMIVFGGGEMTPETGTQGGAFTLTTSNNRPVCGRAASGMMLQTSGRPGRITVNGVTIELASTALIIVGPEPMFDQDPRAQRRAGERNDDAPFCSGFDSDCAFGDDSCATGDRLLFGPYCREDSFPYIHAGLYRVTLYGQGQVRAGATDFATFGERFLLANEALTLPADYTFCWPGLAEGGSGFETVVEAVSAGARIDRITVDYLGEDCGVDATTLGASRDNLGFMTVYNVEGSVRAGEPSGTVSIPPGDRLRVHYDGATPVRLDGPTHAPYITTAPLALYLTYGANGAGGLPAIVTDWPTDTAQSSLPGLTILSVTTDQPNEYCFQSQLGVEVHVAAAQGVQQVTLWRRIYGAAPGEPQFEPVPMQRRADGVYFAALDTGVRDTLDFYVEAVDGVLRRVASPVQVRSGGDCSEGDAAPAAVAPAETIMEGWCAPDPDFGNACSPDAP